MENLMDNLRQLVDASCFYIILLFITGSVDVYEL